MAASKPVEPQSGTGLPRWQLALLVGAPIVLGVGAVYLWNRSRAKGRPGKGSGERITPEGSASPEQGQDSASRSNQGQDNMVPLGEFNQAAFLFCTTARVEARWRRCGWLLWQRVCEYRGGDADQGHLSVPATLRRVRPRALRLIHLIQTNVC